MLILFASPGLLACGRKETASVAPTASASAAPSASISSAPAAGVTLTHEQVKAALVAWNDALDRHDTSALAPLYADTVDYYGKKLGGPAVVQMKAKALKRDSEFHQQIVGDPTFVDGDDIRVDFVKRSGRAPKLRDVKASLLVGLRNDKVVILRETDEPTESRAAKQAAAPETNEGPSWQRNCENAADEVVNALPQVKKEVADLEKAVEKSERDVHMGGIGPEWDQNGGFSATIGIDNPERFENYIFYGVDSSGVLSVTIGADDLPIPAAAQARVKKACTPPQAQ